MVCTPFFWLLCLISLGLTGCFDNSSFDPIHTDVILEASQPSQPDWVYRDFVEAKTNIYFVRSIRTEFHMPTFAYNLVRRDFHEFLDKEVDYLLNPVLKNLSKNKFNTLKIQSKLFLSKKLMVELRTNRVIYWEKVSYKKNRMDTIGYWYYVLLPLPRRSLRLLEQEFLLNQIEMAKRSRRKMLIQELEASLLLLNALRDNDRNRASSLPEDFTFKAEKN